MANPDKPDYTHGSTGTKPQSSIDYDDGDSLESENLDYFINTPFQKIKSIIDTLVAIDSDGDGVVDRADSAASADDASAYKGNDIDSDGDGKVNSADVADNATAYKGNDIDSDGDGIVDAADSATNATNVTSTYKDNDIDSDGDGKVDSAENADYASDADASSYKGVDIDSDGDGTVDSADDATNVTSTYKGNDIDTDGDGKVNAAVNADDADTLAGNTPNDLLTPYIHANLGSGSAGESSTNTIGHRLVIPVESSNYQLNATAKTSSEFADNSTAELIDVDTGNTLASFGKSSDKGNKITNISFSKGQKIAGEVSGDNGSITMEDLAVEFVKQ